MFKTLKKALFGQDKAIDLQAPCAGQLVSLLEVADPVFSQGMMGKGIGVKPSENQIFAPCDAKVTHVFPTKHAITLQAGDAELLIHIGIDTVKLQGKYFTSLVKTNEKVKAGQALIKFDLPAISAIYDPTVMMLVVNADEFKQFKIGAPEKVDKHTPVIKLSK